MPIDDPKNDQPDELNETEYLASRTKQKRAAQELRELGEELVKLNQDRLNKIPLSDELIHAIATAKRIKSNNALKRQSQFIGKLIRKSDVDAIQSALDSFQKKDSLHPAYIQKTEQWRDRLLTEGNTALSQFIDEYPHSNRQLLGQLLRSATKEQKLLEERKEKSSPDVATAIKDKAITRHTRALFKELRTIIS